MVFNGLCGLRKSDINGIRARDTELLKSIEKNYVQILVHIIDSYRNKNW